MTGPLPSTALSQLMAQHDALRALMLDCERLTDALDAGAGAEVATELAGAVKRLRIMFDAHNKFEETILRPVLLEADAFGAVRVDQMVEAHVSEHRQVGAQLATLTGASLRAVFATLRQHLAEEERYFLSSHVLHDDLVSIEASS